MRHEPEQVLEALPKFPSDERVPWRSLTVTGLVGLRLSLTAEDLSHLPFGKTVDDFRCEEGWVVPEQAWEGPSVWTILERAGIDPEARFATFSAGDFSITLDMQETINPDTRLALWLNGEPIPEEHGGPCRLIVPGKACYASVKWVDRIEVSSERPRDTAPTIALERISGGQDA